MSLYFSVLAYANAKYPLRVQATGSIYAGNNVPAQQLTPTDSVVPTIDSAAKKFSSGLIIQPLAFCC